MVQLSVKDLISKFGAKTETVWNGVDRSKRKEGDSMENYDVANKDVQEVEMDNTLKDDEVCEQNLDLETKVRLGCNKVNMFIKRNRTKTTFGWEHSWTA